jgi:hypothetical protein
MNVGREETLSRSPTMVATPLLECSFLIPIRRDTEISDGELHSTKEWVWLTEALEEHFGGWTRAPGTYEGTWKSATTGRTVADQSYRYVLAVSADQIDSLHLLLAETCAVFQQQVIYLAVAGQVEFIPGPRHDPP